ncbi:hypothetical protein LTSEINV_2578 [Salmonella enterica subsp. enterica serovar Inverness str. R8-3668]|uniref:Uncharacterized protein n=1 Tax=Salmonella enterica subsp. enterica serovar Inverness str. R8-3668 TaxID=913075 RepID=G5ND66_SALET|nr:hypothetical protein LTSEINV_2578 [Salmonella enterica subsp. enterica serovar Inverness str. R8-3668]
MYWSDFCAVDAGGQRSRDRDLSLPEEVRDRDLSLPEDAAEATAAEKLRHSATQTS